MTASPSEMLSARATNSILVFPVSSGHVTDFNDLDKKFTAFSDWVEKTVTPMTAVEWEVSGHSAAGDIIATGTPAGVGIGFTPPKYLVPGDVARIEVEKIGVLENEFREISG